VMRALCAALCVMGGVRKERGRFDESV